MWLGKTLKLGEFIMSKTNQPANGLTEEIVRKWYQVIKEHKYNQAQLDKEYKMMTDAGVVISKSDYSALVALQEKMSFEEFSNFYLHGENPAIKLQPQELEALKAGLTIGQWVGVGIGVEAGVLLIFT
jgi:hypothetical protein